jgi:DNA mismatch endonuclease (patch repair protein)
MVRAHTTMADKLTKEARSRNMAAIRSCSTLPERQVIRHLRRAGFRVFSNQKDLPGRPDAVIPSARTIVFVHGCFWHQHGRCADSRLPQSNAHYWTPKLAANKRRDSRRMRQLRRMGWHVFVIWDCQVTTLGLKRLTSRIVRSQGGVVKRSTRNACFPRSTRRTGNKRHLTQ